MAGLELVPVFLPGQLELLDRLGGALGHALRLRIGVRQPWFDAEVSYDPLRGQYSSARLLRLLLDDPTGSTAKILGVVGVDLFAPVLTYVFGEAQLGGRAAVVSTHRLRTEAYGLPADEPLLFERLLKESIHEIGHLLGLLHCTDPACVMHASTYVEEIDIKTDEFCMQCFELAHDTLGRQELGG